VVKKRARGSFLGNDPRALFLAGEAQCYTEDAASSGRRNKGTEVKAA